MAELLTVPGVDILVRAVLSVVFVYFFIKAIKDVIQETKTKSFKEAIDELLISLIYLAVFMFVFYNLELVANLVDSIFAMIVRLLEGFIEFIGGS